MTKDQQLNGEFKDNSTGSSAFINELIVNLTSQNVSANATNLARQGRYKEAESLLAAGVGESNSNVLDLLARIKAQQGNLIDAERIWRQALQLDPDNNACQVGLQKIAKIQQRSIWLTWLWPLLVGFVAVVVLSVAALPLFNRVQKKTLAELITQQQQTNERLAALQNSQQELSGKLAVTQLPDVKLAVTGMTTKAYNNEVVLLFSDGLFLEGTIFKPGVKKMLAELGQQLLPYSNNVSLRIIGCADDMPMPEQQKYHDNVALGLARAVTVTDYLRTATSLPANIFSIGSQGEISPPFPNDSPENRSRNRTVVVRVSNSIRN